MSSQSLVEAREELGGVPAIDPQAVLHAEKGGDGGEEVDATEGFVHNRAAGGTCRGNGVGRGCGQNLRRVRLVEASVLAEVAVVAGEDDEGVKLPVAAKGFEDPTNIVVQALDHTVVLGHEGYDGVGGILEPWPPGRSLGPVLFTDLGMGTLASANMTP